MKVSRYLGGIVKLRRDIHTVGGDLLPKGSTYVVTSIWRGRLTLGLQGSQASKTVGRHIHRGYIDLIAERLA